MTEFRQTSLRDGLEVFEAFVRGLELTWQGKLVIENGKCSIYVLFKFNLNTSYIF